MAKKSGKGTPSKSSKGAKPEDIEINDERFSSMRHDPRFRVPKKQEKIKLDDRFKKSDLESTRKSKVDRYGRNIKDLELEDDTKDFDKYYEEHKEESEASGSEDSEDSEDSEKIDTKKESKIESVDRARGLGVSSESESESEPDSDSDSDLDSEFSDADTSDEEIVIEEGEPEAGDPSHRLALVNMDWDNVSAVDLMATFKSFLPTSGEVKRVTIYPSEFGKEKMKQEEVEGPPRELFKSKKKAKSDSDSDLDSDLDSDINLKGDFDLENRKEKIVKMLYEEDKGEEYDSKNLRRYQLQRLRYYYAVIECDSVSTAEKLYKECDGLEFESTSNFFDLRYIPDDMEFAKEGIKETCDKIPTNYKPKINFETSALQHSKVKLTWDETPAERLKVTSKAFNAKEIEEMDFKAYLASDSDESEQEEKGVKDKYKDLLKSSVMVGNKNIFEKAENEEDDVDMEITFTPGLADGEAGEANDKDALEESTIEKYKRKAKERKKNRKEQIKERKKTGGKESKADDNSDEEDAKNNAELELVTMDSKPGKNHFDMKHIMKAEKQKTKKKDKKKGKKVDDEFLQEDFEADLQDSRFKDIFEDERFAIDPNQPEFKKTATMVKIMEERNKRYDSISAENEPSSKRKSKNKNKNKSTDAESKPEKRTSDLTQLAEKIRKKHKKAKS